MTIKPAVVCGLALLTVAAARAMAQQPVYQSKPVTQTATIEAIDKATRTVTLKTPKGISLEIEAPDEMQGFDTLKVGDQVSATYYEAMAVRVRRPGEPAAPSEPTTVVQRKENTPGSETRREETFTVTVDAIDTKAPSVRVKGPKGRTLTMAVRDPKQLQNLKVGDTVDITYYESLLVKVERPPKKK